VKKWLLAALLLVLPALAEAQSVPGPTIQTGACGAFGGPLCTIWTASQWVAAWQAKVDVQGGTLNTPTITGGIFTGITLNSTTLNAPTIAGAALSGTFSGTPIFSGLVTGTAGLSLTDPASIPTFSMTGNNSVMGNSINCGGIATATWECISGNITGTSTSTAPNFMTWNFLDSVQTTHNLEAVNIQEIIAPNGNTATGPRVTLNVFQEQLGAVNGGSYIYSGESSAARFSTWMEGNVGGTPTLHQGAITNFNPTTDSFTGATDTLGSVIQELDMQAQAAPTFTGTISSTTLIVSGVTGTIASGMCIFGSGVSAGTCILSGSGTTWTVNNSQSVGPVAMTSSSSFLQEVGELFVEQSGDAQEGWLGPAIWHMFANQAGASAGVQTIMQIGEQTAAWPMWATGRIIAFEPSYSHGSYPVALGSFDDTAFATYHGCKSYGPYTATCGLQATGITSATRLTSDGLAANGYIRDAQINAIGSGYTAEPLWTVTGCTGAVIHSGALVTNPGGLSEIGVYTPGTGCVAETTASPASGAATAYVLIGGNTLNLPINSTNLINCSVSVKDTGPGAIAYTIAFVATMGATSSTTAIVGSPSWTAFGTDAAISLAAPTADTTLGAVNITLTPTAVTATVGGSCTIVSDQQFV
jgi:hypothetical protein